MTNDRETIGNPRAPASPPWVWFWILYFLFMALPWAFNLVFYNLIDMISRQFGLEWTNDSIMTECLALAKDKGLDSSVCQIEPESMFHFASMVAPAVADLFPYLVLCLGVGMSFLPFWMKQRNIVRRQATPLLADYPSPVVQAIREEIGRVHAALVPMNCLSLPTITAFVSPLSFRKTALVVGGAMPAIWRRNADVGKAIIGHEATHWRQGEAALLNVGSPLVDSIRYMPLVYLLFVIIPQFILATLNTISVFTFVNDTNSITDGTITDIPYSDPAMFALKSFLTYDVPGAIYFAVLALCNWTWLISGLIGAFWAAELVADRSALGTNVEGYIAELKRQSPAKGWYHRLQDLLVHPPLWLRTSLARRPDSGLTLLTTLLVFPVSLITGELLMIISDWITTFLPFTDPVGLIWAKTIDWLPDEVSGRFSWLSMPFIAIGCAILLWPLVMGGMQYLSRIKTQREPAFWPYPAVATFLICLGLAPHFAS